jgi:hypothetical protein
VGTPGNQLRKGGIACDLPWNLQRLPSKLPERVLFQAQPAVFRFQRVQLAGRGSHVSMKLLTGKGRVGLSFTYFGEATCCLLLLVWGESSNDILPLVLFAIVIFVILKRFH